MAISYPTTLDTLTNPTSSDNLDTTGVLHDVQHSDLNDIVEALEAKVGVNNSTVSSSHEYLLQHAHSPATAPTYNASQVIDMNGSPYQFITLTGNISFTTTNRGSSTNIKVVNVIVDPGASNRSLDFSSSMIGLGLSNPISTQTFLSGKKGMVTFISTGSAETDTFVSIAPSN